MNPEKFDHLLSFVKDKSQKEIQGLGKAYRVKKGSESVTQRCSVKNVFLEVSQNSQENTCARVSLLIKLQNSGLQLY